GAVGGRTGISVGISGCAQGEVAESNTAMKATRAIFMGRPSADTAPRGPYTTSTDQWGIDPPSAAKALSEQGRSQASGLRSAHSDRDGEPAQKARSSTALAAFLRPGCCERRRAPRRARGRPALPVADASGSSRQEQQRDRA